MNIDYFSLHKASNANIVQELMTDYYKEIGPYWIYFLYTCTWVWQLNHYNRTMISLFTSWLFLFSFLTGDELHEEEDSSLPEYSQQKYNDKLVQCDKHVFFYVAIDFFIFLENITFINY